MTLLNKNYIDDDDDALTSFYWTRFTSATVNRLTK